jgi:hypothetical protein
MGKQKIELAWAKLTAASQHLRTMRQCPEYGIVERTALRELVDIVDDGVRPINTKMSRVNETFGEMKDHKEFKDSITKAEKIIEKTQDLKDSIVLGKVEIEFEPLKLKIPTDKAESKFLDIYYEYEGLFW